MAMGIFIWSRSTLGIKFNNFDINYITREYRNQFHYSTGKIV